MIRGKPTSTKDLLTSERNLLDAIRTLGFGQIESLRIRAGEPVLDPWPTVVRDLKFGVDRQEPRATSASASPPVGRRFSQSWTSDGA